MAVTQHFLWGEVHGAAAQHRIESTLQAGEICSLCLGEAVFHKHSNPATAECQTSSAFSWDYQHIACLCNWLLSYYSLIILLKAIVSSLTSHCAKHIEINPLILLILLIKLLGA